RRRVRQAPPEASSAPAGQRGTPARGSRGAVPRRHAAQPAAGRVPPLGPPSGRGGRARAPRQGARRRNQHLPGPDLLAERRVPELGPAERRPSVVGADRGRGGSAGRDGRERDGLNGDQVRTGPAARPTAPASSPYCPPSASTGFTLVAFLAGIMHATAPTMPRTSATEPTTRRSVA